MTEHNIVWTNKDDPHHRVVFDVAIGHMTQFWNGAPMMNRPTTIFYRPDTEDRAVAVARGRLTGTIYDAPLTLIPKGRRATNVDAAVAIDPEAIICDFPGYSSEDEDRYFIEWRLTKYLERFPTTEPLTKEHLTPLVSEGAHSATAPVVALVGTINAYRGIIVLADGYYHRESADPFISGYACWPTSHDDGTRLAFRFSDLRDFRVVNTPLTNASVQGWLRRYDKKAVLLSVMDQPLPAVGYRYYVSAISNGALWLL